MAITINGSTGISGVDGDATTPALQGGDTNTGISFGTDEVRINTGGTQRVVVDASGQLGLGTSSPASFLHIDSDNTYGSVVLSRDGGVAGRRPFGIGISGPTDANLRISASTDTSGANAFATQILEITAAGNVGIGTTSPSTKLHIHDGSGSSAQTIKIDSGGVGLLSIQSGTTTDSRIEFGDSANDDAGYIYYENDNDVMRFGVNGAERARIDSSGRLLVGTSTSIASESLFGVVGSAGDSGCIAEIQHSGNAGANRDFIRFYNSSGTEAGSIEHDGNTSVAFRTSSDYRLKENIVPVTSAIERVVQLKPCRFNFISEPNRIVDGFIAHEVQAVVPESVGGEKDAVDDEGNPVYQGIDQSKLVPLLTAALQEAITRIETLEAEVQALKGA